MRWLLYSLLTLLLLAVLAVGCGENSGQITSPDAVFSIRGGGGLPVPIPAPPDDPEDDPYLNPEVYLAGLAEILAIQPGDTTQAGNVYWHEHKFTVGFCRGPGQTLAIDLPNWNANSTITAIFTPGAGTSPPTSHEFIVYVPITANNYLNATVFKLDNVPGGGTVDLYVVSSSIFPPGPGSSGNITSFASYHPDPTQPIDPSDILLTPYDSNPNYAYHATFVSTLEKPNGDKDGTSFDGTDPPVGDPLEP